MHNSPTLCLAVSLLLALLAVLHATEPKKPNVIFILADDLSYGDLGYTGQKLIATPHIDRLAAAGLRFTQAYAGAPECAPSRASLMTGMHMGHCRIRANRAKPGSGGYLRNEDVTLAETLKSAGYSTGFVGKWGMGLMEDEGAPFRQGFDYSFGYYDQGRAHSYYPDFLDENDHEVKLDDNKGFDMAALYAHSKADKNRYDAQGNFLAPGVADPAKAKNSQTLIHTAGLDFIRRSKDRPFFLYYATQLPHGPVVIPNLGSYKDKDWPLKNKEWAGMVSWLDQCVGEITALLRELNLEQDTIIFFAGDNGYSQWGYFARKAWSDDPLFQNKGPWPGGKFALYEGGCRVPFFVSWPGQIAARASGHVCALYDVMPTLAELAGIPSPPTDGISFVPELFGKSDQQNKHDYLYWENGSKLPHGQAVRFGPWYAMRAHPEKPLHVFDVEKDPGCTGDLAAGRSDLVTRAKAIFTEAHTDSASYINPGEPSPPKRQKAKPAKKPKQ
jgi:arylsulfatase A-like enzyme